MKIWNAFKYLIERLSPYLVAIIVVGLCRFYKFNMMDDKNYKELLNGLVTLDSIIIGFLGTVMPVILSMKNESKFVRYVFEKDKNNLFCKYLKVTILLGIINVVFSLLMHVRCTMVVPLRMKSYYGWIFVSTAFLVATYRSMSYMISLIFTRDSEDLEKGDVEDQSIGKSRRNELQEIYKSKF